jgi:hypothetical protein
VRGYRGSETAAGLRRQFQKKDSGNNNERIKEASMRRVQMSYIFMTILLAVAIAFVGQAEAVVISDHCVVIGSGTLPNGDVISGSVVPVDGVVGGTWEHWQAWENSSTCDDYGTALHGLCTAYCKAMDCTGDAPAASEEACLSVRSQFFGKGGDRLPCEPYFNYFVGDIDRMFCWRNGVVLADFWGTGTFNGEPGYSYHVHVQDYGAEGPDLYQVNIWAPDGTLALSAADYLSSGNLEVLP